MRCAPCMGAPKIFESPWVRQRLLVPKFLIGFCSDRSYQCLYKIWSLYFTHSWDNRDTQKIWIRPGFLFSQIFNELLFRSILWMCVQNFKFVALPIPEIIGGTQKIWTRPGFLFSQIFNGLLFGSTCTGVQARGAAAPLSWKGRYFSGKC